MIGDWPIAATRGATHPEFMNPYEFGRQPESPAFIATKVYQCLFTLTFFLFLYIAALRLWSPLVRSSALPSVRLFLTRLSSIIVLDLLPLLIPLVTAQLSVTVIPYSPTILNFFVPSIAIPRG